MIMPTDAVHPWLWLSNTKDDYILPINWRGGVKLGSPYDGDPNLCKSIPRLRIYVLEGVKVERQLWSWSLTPCKRYGLSGYEITVITEPCGAETSLTTTMPLWDRPTDACCACNCAFWAKCPDKWNLMPVSVRLLSPKEVSANWPLSALSVRPALTVQGHAMIQCSDCSMFTMCLCAVLHKHIFLLH